MSDDDILSQFREEDLPPSTVDIARAVRAGRRRRWTLPVVAAAMTVVAILVAAFALLPAPPDPAPPVVPTCGSPAPAPSSIAARDSFDPLISEIDASGVPDYRVTVIGTATYWQSLGMINTAGDREVQVTVYARGGKPHSVADETVPVDPASGVPAEPVRGTPAYWLPPNGPSDPVALAWQWSPGAWAIVAPAGVEESPSPAELRTIATRVAPQLAFDAGTPVTAPFALPVPDGMYPAMTLTMRGIGQESIAAFNLGFDPLGTAAPTHVAGYVPHLWVTANTYATVDQLPAGATAYPEDLGYPAFRSDLRSEGRDSDLLLVYDFFGLAVEIEPRGLRAPRDEKLRYAADIFRTMTVFPGAATDPSVWREPTC